MPLIRLQDRVPEVYVDESRDFQLILRTYDCVLNGVKFDIDTIPDIIDTSSCSSRLLQLLQTKLGFFSNAKVTDNDLRVILDAFPTLIRNKGSKKALEEAIYVFLRLNHIKTGTYIAIVNDNANNTQWESYSINIGIESTPKDTTILTELLKYIAPTGYVINYFFYVSAQDNQTEIIVHDDVTYAYSNNYLNSLVQRNIDGFTIHPEIFSQVISGYYSNGKFYVDSTHTTEITPLGESDLLVYKDLSESKYYIYINSAYKLITYSEQIVAGYYDNGKFYEDASHTIEIVPVGQSGYICYLDKTSDKNTFYIYGSVNGTPSYIQIGKANIASTNDN